MTDFFMESEPTRPPPPVAESIRSGLWKRHLLGIITLISGVVGFAVGHSLRLNGLADRVPSYVDIPGRLIFHGYSMLLVPVIFCGIILGLATLQHAGSGRVVAYTCFLFLSLMISTSVFGCLLASWTNLGHHVIGPNELENDTDIRSDKRTVVNAIEDFFENAVPENLIQATFSQKYTLINDDSNETTNFHVLERVVEYNHETNFVGLMVFCLIFGSSMAALGNKVSTMYIILEEINAIVSKMLGWLFNLLPLGIFFWLFCQGLSTSSLADTFARYGFYLSVFFGTQLSYHFVFLPLLYLLLVRKNPIVFHAKLFPLILMAFGTSSSAATFPLSLNVMEERVKCHTFVTRFAIPLGSLINKQGSTLGTPLTVFFIAGMQGIRIGTLKTVILATTNVLLQMAFPGVPGNGLNVLWFLYFVGVYKPYVIGLVFAIEWLLDRVTTVNNVVGDCYVAAIVEKICHGWLQGHPRLLDDADPVQSGAPIFHINDLEETCNRRTENRLDLESAIY